MIERKPWTRDELIIAINLYCKTPFGKIHYRNPEIIELANKLGRSPGSVGYKLANFASIDPSLDRKGASNVSKLDKQVWAEFYDNWDEMAFESEKLLAKLEGKTVADIEPRSDDAIFGEGKTRNAIVKTRVNQAFFRKMVLSAYDNTCCITGLSIPDLLIASHIVPWAEDKKNRLNPRNGLCMNALHDRAFDRGLITILPDYTVKISSVLKKYSKNTAAQNFMLSYNNVAVKAPKRFLPDLEFLKYHNKKIFRH